MGKQNPKNLFQEVPHEGLPGNPVLDRLLQAPIEKKYPQTYHPTVSKFGQDFRERELQSLSPDEILSFLTQLTEGNKQLTKHTAIPTSAPSSISSRIITAPPCRTLAITP